MLKLAHSESIRFWKKVQASSAEGCWLWTASIDSRGYGQFGTQDGKNRRAHRVSYESVIGSIPEGLDLHHECNNKRCVNWFHLKPLTKKAHIAVGDSPAGKHARKTHCQHGHEFSKENTIIRKTGQRLCRTCSNDWNRKYKQGRKA